MNDSFNRLVNALTGNMKSRKGSIRKMKKKMFFLWKSPFDFVSLKKNYFINVLVQKIRCN